MTNKNHLKTLREGYLSWHKWRKLNPNVSPNLRGTNLHGLSLNNYNFSNTDFESACLMWANLSNSRFSGCNFRSANLIEAKFQSADLRDVSFIRTNLSNVDLRGCKLHRAVFRDVKLDGANFSRVKLYETVFVRCSLSFCIGLEEIDHQAPSVLDHRTISLSRNLPVNFLRGCGLPDRLIDYLPSLLGEAIQYYSCFISYSSKDEVFAKRLHADLQNNGVRCWFAPEDMKIGDKFRQRIDEAIHVHERLLLILSDNSVSSEWVEKEVETAFDKEQRQKRTVLFPVRLDDAVMESHTQLPQCF